MGNAPPLPSLPPTNRIELFTELIGAHLHNDILGMQIRWIVDTHTPYTPVTSPPRSATSSTDWRGGDVIEGAGPRGEIRDVIKRAEPILTRRRSLA